MLRQFCTSRGICTWIPFFQRRRMWY